MICNLNSKCPYNKSCTDCLHSVQERDRRNRPTGLDTSDPHYERDYKRIRERERLETEMRCAGIV